MSGFDLDVDPLQDENHRSDRLLSDFLGLKDEQLCPVFGFDRNTYYLLALQVICGFAILKLCRMFSETVAAPKEVAQDPEPEAGLLQGDQRVSATNSPPPRKRTTSGMSNDDPFATGGGGGDPFASSATSALQSQRERSRQQNFVSLSSTYEDNGGPAAEDREIAALNEEFQNRLARILQDRRQQQEQIDFKSPVEHAMHSQDASRLELSRLQVFKEGDEEPAGISILPIVYWVWQVVMSFILLVSMIISMTEYNGAWTELMRSRGSWAHYNLFVFAYMNSGMLPTGVRAIFYVISCLLEMKSRRGPGGASRLLQIAPGEEEEEADAAAAVDPAEVNKKLFLLMLPLILPVAAAALTHVVPFCFCYPWVLVLAGAIAAALIMLTRFACAQLKVSKKLETDILMLTSQLVVCLFVHSSVPVMIRVFGGEWRHGGYSNQLFSRVFRGEFEHVPCTWFSFSHGVDAVLRWT